MVRYYQTLDRYPPFLLNRNKHHWGDGLVNVLEYFLGHIPSFVDLMQGIFEGSCTPPTFPTEKFTRKKNVK